MVDSSKVVERSRVALAELVWSTEIDVALRPHLLSLVPPTLLTTLHDGGIAWGTLAVGKTTLDHSSVFKLLSDSSFIVVFMLTRVSDCKASETRTEEKGLVELDHCEDCLAECLVGCLVGRMNSILPMTYQHLYIKTCYAHYPMATHDEPPRSRLERGRRNETYTMKRLQPLRMEEIMLVLSVPG